MGTDRRVLLTGEFADEHRRQLLELDDGALDFAIDGFEKNAEAGREAFRRRNLLADNEDAFVQFEVGVDGSAEVHADERGLLEMDSIGLNEYIFDNDVRAYQARDLKHRRLMEPGLKVPEGGSGVAKKTTSPRNSIGVNKPRAQRTIGTSSAGRSDPIPSNNYVPVDVKDIPSKTKIEGRDGIYTNWSGTLVKNSDDSSSGAIEDWTNKETHETERKEVSDAVYDYMFQKKRRQILHNAVVKMKSEMIDNEKK